ncbi:MAG: thioredoxin domain-containing protein [Candidatus ainarchaeum sp.]|nr:thioredoxin domain-containing protein [Candidatus ainarchaeum sp.]
MDGGNDDWRPYALPAAILISAIIVAGAVMASTNGLTGQMRSLEATIRSANFTAAPAGPTPTPAATPTPAPTQAPANLDVAGRPFTGNASAKVTIIAFSDFQCPYCGRAETTMKALRTEYAGKLKYVFMNFPLGFHQYAEKAAEGFECAADQGDDKAFALHDAMFSNQDALTLDDIKGYAAAIQGMDAAAFNSCLDSGRKAQSVASQTALGTANGVDGTPTFFINGKAIVGAQAQSVFKAAIDQALAQAGG